MTDKKVPEYLRKLLEWKKKFMADKAAEAERKEKEYKAKKKKEFEEKIAKRNAQRKPPRNVKMTANGSRLEWEYPETVNEQKPLGYWVSEETPDGTWTKHGDYLIDAKRSGLFYGRAAYVESYYGDQALGEIYRSEIVYPGKAKDADAEKECPNIMPEEQPCPNEPENVIISREQKILDSLDSYNGRYTKVRKMPVLGDLRKHCGYDDITRKERNDIWKKYKK